MLPQGGGPPFSVSRVEMYGMVLFTVLAWLGTFQLGRYYEHFVVFKTPECEDVEVATGATGPAAPGTAAKVPVQPILPDEALTGQLEALLARVQLRDAAASPDAGDLRRALEAKPIPLGVGPDGVMIEPERGVFNMKQIPATPPPPDPFPDAPRTAGGSIASSRGVAAPESVGKVPGDGWAIEVGSTPTEAEARTRVAALTEAGLSAYALPALVASQTSWRVRVGGFPDKDSAGDALASVRARAGAGNATVVHAP